MIRAATHEDIEQLVELGERMHYESPTWSRLSFSREKVGNMLRGLISSPVGLCQVAVEEGTIVGGVLAVVDEHWSSTDKIAAELTLFVAPEARGKLHAVQLVLELQGWATAMGAKLVRSGISTDVNTELAVRLYERLGFVRTRDVHLEYLCAIPLQH